MKRKLVVGVIIASLGLNTALVWLLYSTTQENVEMKQRIFIYHSSYQADTLKYLIRAFENRDNEQKFLDYLYAANSAHSYYLHFGWTPLSKYFYNSNKYDANVYDYRTFSEQNSRIISQAYNEARNGELQQATVKELEKYKDQLAYIAQGLDSNLLWGKSLKEYFIALDRASLLIRNQSIRREIINPEVNMTGEEAVLTATQYVKNDLDNIIQYEVEYTSHSLYELSNLWRVTFHNIGDLNHSEYVLFTVHVYLDAKTGEVFDVSATYSGGEQELEKVD